MLRLFIENAELELGEDFSCPITRSFEDIENPTNIKNDFSKTITIPHTQSNDRLFGHIYNPDRLTVANQKNEALKGIYFDPYKKIDFRLEWNDSVVMTGYLKVLSVTDKGYECTLNGELGKIFQEMQKITFDESKYEGEEKDKYWIDSSEYVNTKINKELVYESWNSGGPTSTKLRKIGDVGYRVTDIIGYTPNNAFNTNFNYKTFQVDDNLSYNFSDVLLNKTWGGATFEQITGITPETVTGDGLTPRAVGEFRSYLQQPFIYWNQLWQIYQEKVESITGYKFDLDPDWFNSSNPYWTKTVMTLMNFDQIQKKLEKETKKYDCKLNYTAGKLLTAGQDTILNITTDAPYFVKDEYGGYFQSTEGTILKLKFNKFNIDYRFNGIPKMEKVCLASGKYKYLTQKNKACFLYADIVATSLDGTKDLKLIQRSITHNIDSVVTPDDSNSQIWTVNYDSFVKISTPTGSYWESNISFNTFYSVLQDITEPFRIKLKIYYNFVSDDPDAKTISRYDIVASDPTTSIYSDDFITSTEDKEINAKEMELKESYYRTNSKFNLNTLWNDEVLIYTQFLNYCKQFKILISTNEIEKTIKFSQSANYFKDYKILDYSNKIDKSKDYNIKPITFENHYILFNYENSKTKLNESYKNHFSYNFGEKRLMTNYKFSQNTEKLFSGISNGICSTYSDLSWKVLLGVDSGITITLPEVSYYIPSEIFANFSDKENKQVDSFGCLFFVNSADFDNADELRNVKISDDTELQIYKDTYFYSNIQKNTTKYLQLNDVSDDKCILFSVPKENYTYLDFHYDNSKGIYDLFWANYINERYNTQNKLVTCYLKLTPSDFINFEFNKFILIDNQLYMVNKIYDYDITNDEPTKVDLITIQDIKGYTTNNLQ